MFQTKVVEKIKTHSRCSIKYFRKIALFMRYVEKECRAGPTTDDNITRCMRIACWIPKATNTHSEWVILIAFPLQQWLHERASTLRRSTLPVLSRFLSVVYIIVVDFDRYVSLWSLFSQSPYIQLVMSKSNGIRYRFVYCTP